MILLLLPAALAGTPRFDADQAVYCLPRCPFATDELETQLDAADLPVYVLFYARHEGKGDPRETMRRSVDRTISAWQADPAFDSQYATVIGLVVDGDARGMWVTPGSQLQTSIPDWEARDDEVFAAHFAPKARLNDFAGALSDYTGALDTLLVDRSGLATRRAALHDETLRGRALAPTASEETARALTERLAALQDLTMAAPGELRPPYRPDVLDKALASVRELLGPLQDQADARAHIADTTEAVDRLLRESGGLLTADEAALYTAAEADAKAAAQGTDLATMQAASATLIARKDALYELLTQRHAEAARRAEVEQAKAITAGVLGLALLALVLLQVNTLLARRRAFRAAAAEWRAKIANAKANFAELLTSRGEVDELRGREGATRALYDEVSALLNGVSYDIDALDSHVARQEALAATARPWRTRPLVTALGALTEVFEFDTGRVTHPPLFGEPQPITLRITPADFEAGVQAKFTQAQARWATVLDANRASKRTARQDLPEDALTTLLARLLAAGAPAAWIADHPLAEDAAAAWAALDALRVRDPVGYVTAVRAAHAREATAVARGAQVLAALDAVATAAAEDAGRPCDPDATVLDDPARQDPAAVDAALADARATLARHVAAATDLPALQRAASAVLAVHAERVRRKEAISHAIVAAAGSLPGADARIADIAAKLEAARARYARLLAEGLHAPDSVAPAQSELDQVRADLHAAGAAAAAARAHLAARRHLAVLAATADVARHCAEAQIDVADFERFAAAREALRATFLSLRAGLPAARAERVRRMAAYDALSDATLFDRGDAIVAALSAEWDRGAPADWAQETARLQDAVAAWDRAVEIVDNRKDVADAVATVADTAAALTAAQSAADGIRALHTAANLRRVDGEVEEAARALAEAREAVHEARTRLAAGDDRAAEAAAFRANRHCAAARSSLTHADAAVATLESTRRRCQEEYAALGARRAQYERELRGYAYARGYDLSHGNGLFDRLSLSGPVDWAVQAQLLDTAHRAWRKSVDSARRAHEAEVARIEAEEAERLAEQRRQEEEAASQRAAAAAAAEAARQASAYHASSTPTYDTSSHGGHGHSWTDTSSGGSHGGHGHSF